MHTRVSLLLLLLLLLLVSSSSRRVLAAQILPDLVIDEDRVSETLQLSTGSFTDACLVDGGCIPSAGVHTLLRFATRTHNLAPEGGDLVIGPTPSAAARRLLNPGQGLAPARTHSNTDINATWEWHACHSHWHLLNYVQADLFFASNLSRAAVTAKHSFCLRSTGCARPGASPGFSCEDQGITAGCYDEYGVGTACQWVVVDGLPLAQEYVLRLTVDPTNFIPESNDTNNVVELMFNLSDVPSCATVDTALPILLCLALIYAGDFV